MKNTKISDKKEFESRQGCFEFGDACRFVNNMIAEMKKSLSAWTKGFMRNFRMQRPEEQKPEQMKLNLMPWLDVQFASMAC